MTELLTRLLNMPLRTQRLAAWSLLLLLLVIGCLMLVLSGVAYEGRFQSLVSQREDAGRLQALLRMRGSLSRLGGSDAPDFQTYLQKGDSPTIVAAGLQTWLTNVSRESGISINTVNLVLPERDDGSQRVALDVDLTGPWAAVTGLLFKIETARPMLIVTRVTLRSNSAGNEQASAEPSVFAQISFEGIMAGTPVSAVKQQ